MTKLHLVNGQTFVTPDASVAKEIQRVTTQMTVPVWVSVATPEGKAALISTAHVAAIIDEVAHE
jgi:6,7-dimethyl-8-ribityllumazine synthase